MLLILGDTLERRKAKKAAELMMFVTQIIKGGSEISAFAFEAVNFAS